MSSDENISPPAAGAVVMDMERKRVGVVMEADGQLVRLRPAGGGASWRARLLDVCPASPMDELRAKVADVNALRVWVR